MTRQGTGQGAGLAWAVAAAATFGTSGSFATSLLDAGWSTGAVVTSRISIAALVLLVPACLQLRRAWPELRAQGPAAVRRSAVMVGLFGVFAVAICQLFYFHAVQRLSVGVALLLEYLGVILVVLWMWLRHGQTPRRLTLTGSVSAMVGLALVLDLTGHQHIDLIGVLWGLGAAVGLAVYFVLSAREGDLLPPLVLAWGGLTVGALSFLVLGAVRVLPMDATFGQVSFSGHRTSWLVPVLGLAVIAAAFAYVAGISASRLLGARLASFVGLTEVLFAVLFAWLLLGQLPTGLQLVGGAFIVGGVTLVRLDEMSRLTTPAGVAEDEADEDSEEDLRLFGSGVTPEAMVLGQAGSGRP
jgi:drug/metabolite transporter (DMT)-like permease